METVKTTKEKQREACKRWKDKNADKVHEYNKQYYKKNKISNKARYDEYNKKRKMKVKCCCGKEVQLQNLKKHMITSIHNKRMILNECNPISRL
jgi:hypothetical protein